jgi:hypothetical protein
MTILIAPSVAEPITVSPALATSIMVSPGLSQGRAVPTRSFGMPLWDLAGAVPSLDQRFAEDRSLVDAVSGQQLIAFSRVTDATEINSAGQLAVVPAGTARFDHHPTTGESLGLLVEEQRTNSIRNNTMVGAVAGTPGTLPTNWVQSILASGLTANVVGIGTTSGINYIDIRILGTTADASGWVVHFEPNTQTAASSGQTWTASCHVSIIGGSTANITQGRVRLIERSGAGGYITEANQSWTAATATLVNNRFSTTRTLGATTGFVQAGVYFQANSGVAIDITLRIGMPQLEAGAFASSYIPTADTAVTRTADLADLISSAIANNIRSFYVEFRSPAVGTRGVVSLNDNTANERLAVITSGTDPRLTVHDGGVEQANINGGTVTANARTRVAVRIDANNFAISINGGAVVTDTSGTLPTVDRLMLGRTQAGEYLNAPIARFTGWTEALPDGTLQALAQ